MYERYVLVMVYVCMSVISWVLGWTMELGVTYRNGGVGIEWYRGMLKLTLGDDESYLHRSELAARSRLLVLLRYRLFTLHSIFLPSCQAGSRHTVRIAPRSGLDSRST